ncbi:MAG: transcriptional regulator [Halolamina sp.]
MADPTATVDLGKVEPAGSRQLGRRSSVVVTGDDDPVVVVGDADGALLAYDVPTDGGPTLRKRWTDAGGADADANSVVALAVLGDGASAPPTASGPTPAVVAGERGPDGAVRAHDLRDGSVRWRYRGADDVGEPADDTRFRLPVVASLATAAGRTYAAVRRYERGANGRRFESVVVAVEADGTLAWRRRVDASPVAVEADGDRVAVAYNRCPGDHRDGLVELAAADGAVRRRWDPPGDGDRRVGDCALVPGGVVAASHADYRGYRLVADGDGFAVRWRVALGRPTARDGETVYAYPNHVLATDAGPAFVTGNTYPEDGRETDARHPDEHAVAVVDDGSVRRRTSLGGFVHGAAVAGDSVVVPTAQHFRDRDGDHALSRVDAATGTVTETPTPGVVTAAAAGADLAAAVEEPVAYHDGDGTLGSYRLHVRRR